jgi:HSP20 family molecular chaperone IbpA
MATNWEELEKWMEEQQLPKGFDIFRQSEWIENYVKSMMNKAIPAASSAFQTTNANVLETKRHVIVTYPIGEAADLSAVRLLAKEDRLKLSGLPGGENETIRLPKLVLPRTCQAEYDGAVLKIKLRKRPPSRKSHVASIQGL